MYKITLARDTSFFNIKIIFPLTSFELYDDQNLAFIRWNSGILDEEDLVAKYLNSVPVSVNTPVKWLIVPKWWIQCLGSDFS